MVIKVFGPGCARCAQAEKIVREAVRETGVDASVEKVTNYREMMAAGIMSTPAVAINGKIMCVGNVPSRDTVKAWLEKA